MIDDWDKILNDMDSEEEKDHVDDWWCSSGSVVSIC